MFLLVYKAASPSWLKYRTPKVVFLHGYCICLVLVSEAVLLLKDIFLGTITCYSVYTAWKYSAVNGR